MKQIKILKKSIIDFDEDNSNSIKSIVVKKILQLKQQQHLSKKKC